MYEGEKEKKEQQIPQTQPQIERKVESASDRYSPTPLHIPPTSHTPQLNFKKKVPDIEIGDMVFQLRKTLK